MVRSESKPYASKAANALREDRADIAICWDGGRYLSPSSSSPITYNFHFRHHARKSEASGFCYVADCILAVLALKRVHRAPSSHPTPTPAHRPRVMYLDLDLHFSDGVSEAFHHSAATAPQPQVLTLSLHHAAPGFFPASPLGGLRDPAAEGFDPFTLAVPLERGAADATFRRVWAGVERVRAAFRPECVVMQCGVDGLAGDPHGVWNWSLADGEGSLGWCVERVCATWGCKVLLLGGGRSFRDVLTVVRPAELALGGYNHPNAARAWAYLTSIAVSARDPSL